jgi:hypothetical protein
MSTPGERALALLRADPDGGPSPEREAQLRAGLERSLGVTLPLAAAAPVVLGVGKLGLMRLLWGAPAVKVTLVALASMAVGSLATVVVVKASRPQVARPTTAVAPPTPSRAPVEVKVLAEVAPQADVGVAAVEVRASEAPQADVGVAVVGGPRLPPVVRRRCPRWCRCLPVRRRSSGALRPW